MVYNIRDIYIEPECDETDIRLCDGRTTAEGRVEVCLNGHWGSVCLDGWDVIDAAVVCRQLGYGGSRSQSSYPFILMMHDFGSIVYSTKLWK